MANTHPSPTFLENNTNLKQNNFEFLETMFQSPDIAGIYINSKTNTTGISGINELRVDEVNSVMREIEKSLPISSTTLPLIGYEINSLGKFAENLQSAENRDFTSLQKAAASVFLSSNKPFELQIKKEYPENKTKYSIFVDKSFAGTLDSCLRSSFGSCDTKEIRSVNPKKYRYISYAAGKKYYVDFDKSSSSPTTEIITNWATAIGTAVLSDDFSISIRFDPIDNTAIHDKISALSTWYSKVTNHDSITIQSGLSSGNNTSSQDDLLNKIRLLLLGTEDKEKKHGTNSPEVISKIKSVVGLDVNSNLISDLKLENKTTESTNYTFSLSNTRKDAYVEHIVKLLQNELIRLYEAEISGLWGMTICIEADTRSTLETAKSILSGSFSSAQFNLEWDTTMTEKLSANPLSYLTYSEATSLIQFPDSDFDGFEQFPNENLALHCPETNSESFRIGKILWNGMELSSEFNIDKKSFTRHTFVCGMTGSGKTNTVFHLLENTSVPFLIIEPVKSEYRRMQGISAHTMNPIDDIALQVNPFWFPKGGNLQYHIDAIKAIISSAFVLYAAMPNILEQCIYRAYVNKGWNIIRGENLYSELVPEEYLYPTFADLCVEVEQYLERSDYEGETLSTYKGALLTRLQSFTTGSKSVLLNTTLHPDYEKWLTEKTVIELDDLSNDADKSIVMGALLIQYYQYLKLHGNNQNENLRHLLVIEEAHRLFKSRSASMNTSGETANPESQLVETLGNMMAEIRAYGEGLIIVDQSPGKVSEDVIKNSSTKIVHRVDNKNDIEMIKTTLLLDNQADILISSLKQGQALIRTEGMKKAAKIIVPLVRTKEYVISNPATRSGNRLDNIANADYVLSNESFCKDLGSVMYKCMNQLLFDAISETQINEFIEELRSQLKRLLFIHGYRQFSTQVNPDFECRVLRSGLRAELNKYYPNQELLIIRMDQFFGRLLSLSSITNVSEKECDVFMDYRQHNIHPLLEAIFMNLRYKCTWYSAIKSLYGQCTIYSDLLLHILNGVNWKKMRDADVNEKFNKVVLLYFLIKPDELVSLNIVDKLALIEIVKNESKIIETTGLEA